MADQRILVLADDLTGALEVGSKFAGAKVKSQVRTAPGLSPRDLQDASGVLVVDSETRHLDGMEAARRIRDLALVAYADAVPIVYKKTDSTLRGNIGAELAALIKAYAGSPLLYVPAYPQMGRTVSSGSLYVDGVLVGDTGFTIDPLNPVKESHIPTLLAAQCALRVKAGPVGNLIDSEPATIAVCDGETDADVGAAASMFANSSIFRLAAGPAAFAMHLARLVDLPRWHPPPLPRARNALIVNGSLHKVSVEQVEQAKRDGFKSIDSRRISTCGADCGWNILEREIATGVASLDFGKHLAKLVVQLLSRSSLDVLVVFGGDSAYAIVEAIGNPTLHPLGEVMEGIPISRIEANDLGSYIGHRDHDLYLVTKAGGFGPRDVLACIQKSIAER